ncbi:3939_t:CDS:2 [Gigaspora rosea]|nr:3939_t:CDS:2 [Gigaspora rosea]
MSKKKRITIDACLKEHPNAFRLMICKYCNEAIEWRSKSIVDNHCLTEIKNEVIEDLIQAFAIANISLEK